MQAIANGKPIVVFDIETSHPNKEQARVIEIAYQVLDAQSLVTLREYTTLVYFDNDSISIDDTSNGIHGITRDDCVAEGREIADVVHDILDDWKDVGTIVSHGVDVDVEILAFEFLRVLSYWPFAHCALVCTKELGAPVCRIPRGRDGYKWPTLLELWTMLHPGRTTPQIVHRASADVQMCVECLRAL